MWRGCGEGVRGVLAPTSCLGSRVGVGVFLVKPKCLIYVNVRMIVHSA